MKRFIIAAAVVTAAFLGVGCTHSAYVNPDEPDVIGGTGIDSQDVRTVAQEMARDLVGTQAIAQAQEKPIVAILPIENSTRFRIDTDIMTLQIRDLLIQNAGSKITFVARDRMPDIYAEREAKRAGEVTSSGEKIVSGADYFLTGTLKSISKSGGGSVSDYIYYSIELIDTENSNIVWAKGYDIKKVGERGVLYR